MGNLRAHSAVLAPASACSGRGAVGGTLARKLARARYPTRIANSGTSSVLAGEFAGEPGVVATSAEELAHEVDLIFLAVPYRAIPALARTVFRDPDGPSVIDAGNYRPERDGPLAGLDADVADTMWVATTLGRRTFKAFNTLHPFALERAGRRPRSSGRIAVPVAGPEDPEKHVIMDLVDDLGFDPVDAGGLATSWRQQPGTPAYMGDLDRAGLKRALKLAVPQRRSPTAMRTWTDVDGLAARWQPSARLKAQLADRRNESATLDETDRSSVDSLLRTVRGVLTRRWDLSALTALDNGARRRAAIKHELPGISDTALTGTLGRLVAQGLVVRRGSGTTTPAPEFELTALGRSLLDGPIRAVWTWSGEHAHT
ncbi:winged helix-turn-helix transcriptional regulator [Nocardia huaxiensis]|uniref:winged helix-turn-helix transcriptional regulator n=1 Tax=Nocardia huaxiensis TaxID=2755382 RepID=UPI001E6097E5|nr:winged helix-turn-helix transcriptional regulator [Nocardia huaxiensis]UFS98250.1 winged helix-turn-helix transcriptional regulator [Nocardia huaxiensis]